MKIRSIRPEFFADPTMAQLSHAARLLYIGLWCYVDDDGRGEWLPKQIDGQIFPLEDVDIHALLEQCVRTARIVRYTDGDRDYFYIPTFTEYQRPNRKYDSKLPDPAECQVVEPDSSQAARKQRVRTARAHAVEVEVEGEVEGEVVREPKGSRQAGNGKHNDLFEAFYQAWHQRPFADGTKLTKSERGRINAAVKEAADLGASADEVLTRATRYRRDWPAIECTPQALLSNWTRFDEASSPEPFDPDNCQHPDDRRAVIDGDTYCGACGKELG